MDYNLLCDKILRLTPKIRSAGVYSTFGGKIFEKVAKGMERLLDKDKTFEYGVQAFMRWKSRRRFAEFFGEPVYTMTRYSKINRITMPCGKSGLLFVSTESTLNPDDIIEDILRLIEKYSDDPSYTPRIPTLNF